MKTTLTALGACLALGLPIAGCGGDDNNDSGAAPATPTEPTHTSGGSANTGGGVKAAGAKVTLKDISFKPSQVTVPNGGTVTWTNEDSVGHDVTKTGGPGPNFKSGDAGGLNNGDTFKQTFDTPGTIKYVCTVHPGMEGTVVVKK